MGFNYLQTDDRDDYLSQFGSKKTGPRKCSVTLKKDGIEILSGVSTWQLRFYLRDNYMPESNCKKIWRAELLKRGYEIVTNYKEV